MKLYIVIFLCGSLCSGKLQITTEENNSKYKSLQTSNILNPIEKERIWPEEAYQLFQDKVYEQQRSIKPDPCVNNKPQDVQLELTMNNQPVYSPNRRSFNKDIIYRPSNTFDSANFEPQMLQEGINLKKLDQEQNCSNNDDNDRTYTRNSSSISAEDLIKDNDLIVTSRGQEATDEIYDFKENPNLLMNLLSAYIKSVTNTQCGDKNKFGYINDAPRRFLLPGFNLPKFQRPLSKNMNLDTLRTNTNTSVSDNDVNLKSNNIQLHRTQTLDSNKYVSNEIKLEPSEYLENRNVDKLNDPTKRHGISYVKKATPMIIDYDRVCYACSSANNPTCLLPDRRTTVKYCRKGITACVSKTFRTGSSLTLIRDCGNSCDDYETDDLGLKYKSCSTCHSDLCNGAYSYNLHSLVLTFPVLLLIVLVKP